MNIPIDIKIIVEVMYTIDEARYMSRHSWAVDNRMRNAILLLKEAVKKHCDTLLSVMSEDRHES